MVRIRIWLVCSLRIDGMMAMRIPENTKIDVTPRQRTCQCVQHETNALVLLEIYVALHRHQQDATAVGADDGAGLSEQEDAVGTGLLERDTLAFVEDELLHELEQGGHDLLTRCVRGGVTRVCVRSGFRGSGSGGSGSGSGTECV